jgi:hypothetical protein
MSACKGSKNTTPADAPSVPDSMIDDREVKNERVPLAVIYKTKTDLYDYVPVLMNHDKTQIVSYPSPSDIDPNGKPIKLKNGYLLDNRGINENVVFLDYTYEEYAQLRETPSLSDLISRIKEKYPLEEIYNCGERSRYKDEIKELNEMIDANFPNCDKIHLN